MTSRVIALDLDGTLLTPQKPFSPPPFKRLNARRKWDINSLS